MSEVQGSGHTWENCVNKQIGEYIDVNNLTDFPETQVICRAIYTIGGIIDYFGQCAEMIIGFLYRIFD